MRKLVAYLFILFILSCKTGDQSSSSSVEAMLKGMTLKEKIGQMTQLNIDLISVGEIYNLQEPHQLDQAKLHKAIVEYKVGSILNAGGHAYDLKHWHEIIKEIQQLAIDSTDNQIPVLYGIDAIHGANYLLEGTLFPQPLAQAATFNPALVEQGASITAYETRASGIPWNFSPVLDVARQPLWSRVFETYGEDVYLATEMGKACIKGYQGEDASDPEKVASCMKHFLGYSWSFSGKDRTSAYIPRRQLREYFLPTFKAAIEQGSLSVMINSGDVNGLPVHANKEVLTDLLRDELKFDGVAVTDWEDIMKLEHPHRVAKDLKEAVKIAVNAGIDMSMVPNDYRFSDLLYELVREGEVKMSRIDEAVRRILTMKERLNLFEEPFSPDSHQYPLVGSDSFVRAAEVCAEEAITLLKNEGNVLPLNKTQRALVCGPTANSLIMVNGSWGRTWQGTDEKWDDQDKNTIQEAIKNIGARAQFILGCEKDKIVNMPRAMSAAGNSDVIIACMGEFPSTEKPGDINNLSLENAQIEFVKNLAKSGKPIVLVLVQNRPRIIREIEGLCSAIIMAYQPSDNGTNAIAKVLYGEVNPCGKLPITYPRYTNTLFTYDHRYTDRLDNQYGEKAFNPQFEFGDGLSYSQLEYGPMKFSSKEVVGDQEIEVNIDVKNAKGPDAKETVLVFVSDIHASVAPAVKRLRAFDKKLIKSGETSNYSFSIKPYELAFVNKDLQWEVEEGAFKIEIGNQVDTIYYKP